MRSYERAVGSELLGRASKMLQSVRRMLLSRENRRRLRKTMQQRQRKNAKPVFFIFTPDIVHFAPYCVPLDIDGFDPILVLNSVSAEDEAWIRNLYPQCSIVSLKVSLTGNENSLLSHGEVLNDLFAVSESPFCIQDPDCFVTDRQFWEQVSLDVDREFAAGPFTKRPSHQDHVLPDTFFLLLNPRLFRTICGRYRISSESTSVLIPKAQQRIGEIDYRDNQFPEQFKNYFDTLQAFWLLAMAEGYEFRHLQGAGQSVFHIGGTSYLQKSDYDLTHWDYWPLSVIYFNLCLLERPLGERFRVRFGKILARYGTSEKLLEAFPEFGEGRRFNEMRRLLNLIVV